MSKTNANRPFCEFVEKIGGDAQAASALRISVHTVISYKRGRRQVSREVAKSIATITRGEIGRIPLLYPEEAA